MKDLTTLDNWRDKSEERALRGEVGESVRRVSGIFRFKIKGQRLLCIASASGGWDHVSVSHQARPPRWHEMDAIKRRFFEAHETAMQLHVPTAEHINAHPNTLHLWRPHWEEIPLPPADFV